MLSAKVYLICKDISRLSRQCVQLLFKSVYKHLNGEVAVFSSLVRIGSRIAAYIPPGELCHHPSHAAWASVQAGNLSSIELFGQ